MQDFLVCTTVKDEIDAPVWIDRTKEFRTLFNEDDLGRHGRLVAIFMREIRTALENNE